MAPKRKKPDSPKGRVIVIKGETLAIRTSAQAKAGFLDGPTRETLGPALLQDPAFRKLPDMSREQQREDADKVKAVRRQRQAEAAHKRHNEERAEIEKRFQADLDQYPPANPDRCGVDARSDRILETMKHDLELANHDGDRKHASLLDRCIKRAGSDTGLQRIFWKAKAEGRLRILTTPTGKRSK